MLGHCFREIQNSYSNKLFSAKTYMKCFCDYIKWNNDKQSRDLRYDCITLLVRKTTMINGIMTNRQKP